MSKKIIKQPVRKSLAVITGTDVGPLRCIRSGCRRPAIGTSKFCGIHQPTPTPEKAVE